jgi:hypothetical protein
MQALSLSCPRWLCFAAHPSGVGGGLATRKPTLTTRHTNSAFRCQYNRSDRAVASPPISGYRLPEKHEVKIEYLETYPHKPRRTAYSTRHNFRRVRHSCLQAALEDVICAQGTRACIITHVLWLLHTPARCYSQAPTPAPHLRWP